MRSKKNHLSAQKLIVLVFLFQFIIFSNHSFAEITITDLNKKVEENPKRDEVFMDKVIGTTFRGLARSFVAMTDINKLRESNIAKLEKMSDDKFSKKYTKVYAILKDLPEDVKHRYAITPAMTREQAIANMKNLDKKQTYKLIDVVPNMVIANAFYKNFKQESKNVVKKETMVERIKTIWQSMMKKVWFEKNTNSK
ncbi:MAG TPA: hypothetical protein DCL35_02400 [Candidatus Omnitrophica bacterium]|nr:hypothetical protein [Candidatus Omnitrophota bacterium]